MVRTSKTARRNSGKTVSLEIVHIDWGEQQVDGVDIKLLAAKGQRDDCSVSAWDDETALAVALRPGDFAVEGLGVISRSKDEGGTSVEDSATALESEIRIINGNGEVGLPETVLVDVIEGNEGLGVELGLVKTSECNLSIIETVGNSRNLVRRDGLFDQSMLRKRLDGGRDTLVGKGRLG